MVHHSWPTTASQNFFCDCGHQHSLSFHSRFVAKNECSHFWWCMSKSIVSLGIGHRHFWGDSNNERVIHPPHLSVDRPSVESTTIDRSPPIDGITLQLTEWQPTAKNQALPNERTKATLKQESFVSVACCVLLVACLYTLSVSMKLRGAGVGVGTGAGAGAGGPPSPSHSSPKRSKTGKVMLRKTPLFAYYSLAAVCLLFVLIRQALWTELASFNVVPDAGFPVIRNNTRVLFNNRYTPKLLEPEDFMTFNGIHIVRSRYQQGQPNLTALGWARLELFKDFCLPSMVHQTTDNFVWLIYTDPQLDKGLLDAMVELLAPHPRFYLIASMHNVLWKDGQAQNLTEAIVYTGNQTFLEETMAKRDLVPILETRLDADDALHVRFLEDMQKEAANFFYRQGVRWMYWCVEEELQWYWIGPRGATEHQRKYGITESRTNKDFCPTPGLTLGYNVGVETSSIYRRKHSVIIERLYTKEEDMCAVGWKGKDCVQIVRRYPYPAMRTRTPTSSSMIMVEHDHEKLVAASLRNDTGFELLATDFGIKEDLCGKAVKYLNEHIRDIAKEALMGACVGLFCPVSNCFPNVFSSEIENIMFSLLSHCFDVYRREPRNAWNESLCN